MRSKLFIISTLFLMIGCKGIGLNDDSGVGEVFCTLVGSRTVIRVHVTSSTPLPSNVAASLNGNDIDADECVNNGLPFSSVRVSDDRTEADITFFLHENPDDYELYFPVTATEPQLNLMSLGFYGRTTCGDTPSEFDKILDTQIFWEPVYANGENCGITSYAADAQVQTH